jgi:hypothetical protein
LSRECTVNGKSVHDRLVLKHDGRTLNRLTIGGSTGDLPDLTAQFAEAIR